MRQQGMLKYVKLASHIDSTLSHDFALLYSALDPVSEAAIIGTIIKLRDEQGITIVSVSHHPATATEADTIFVVDKGVIVEQGTYKELVRLPDGHFRGLVDPTS